MAYVDGFVLAVPTANKGAFIDYAKKVDHLFIKHGALQVLECWGDDVPTGDITDFYGAVNAKPDETIMFSWVLWPAGMKRFMPICRPLAMSMRRCLLRVNG